MQSFINKPKQTRGAPRMSPTQGYVGHYFKNGLPVTIDRINQLPSTEVRAQFPFLSIISWPYDGTGNKGMPSEEERQRMLALEEAIETAMEKNPMFIHAYSRTGNHLKELVYYSKYQEDFMSILSKALKNHENYPIDIRFYEDREWSDFRKMQNHIGR